jgi:hypothetical protein
VSSAWVRRLVVVAWLVSAPHVAAAQSAEAEQRFRDGKRLMGEKKYAEACLAFETSQRLDPAVTTLVNLADCREKNGQIQSAWTAFLEAERQTRGDAKQASLHKIAKERSSALEGRLSYLTVSVSRDSDIEGLILTRNGQPFDEGLWNTAIPVDGGEYVIAGRAPGHEQWSTTVTVPAEKGRITVDVPRFKAVDRLVPPPVTEPEAVDEVPIAEGEPSSFTGRRKLALGVGGAGLVAVGAGIVLGLQASSLDDEANELCPTLTGCANADAANDKVDQARSRALYANIAYGVGGAAIVAAAVLWLTGGPEDGDARTAVAPVITPSSVGVDVAVRF